jgi:hypothetical protein
MNMAPPRQQEIVSANYRFKSKTLAKEGQGLHDTDPYFDVAKECRLVQAPESRRSSGRSPAPIYKIFRDIIFPKDGPKSFRRMAHLPK